MRASADVDVTKSDSLLCCQEIRVTAEVRPTDAPRGPWDRSATYYGVDPCSRKAHALQDNCVHKSCVSYGNLRCRFQDRASASIHVCPAVRGHLRGSVVPVLAGQRGDFREFTGLYWAASHRARGSSTTIAQFPQPARARPFNRRPELLPPNSASNTTSTSWL